MQEALHSYLECQNSMDDIRNQKVSLFENDNNSRCEQQRLSAEGLAEKIANLSDINTLKSRNNLRQIPAFEGQIKKQNELLDQKLAIIEMKKKIDLELIDELVGGVIIVT